MSNVINKGVRTIRGLLRRCAPRNDGTFNLLRRVAPRNDGGSITNCVFEGVASVCCALLAMTAAAMASSDDLMRMMGNMATTGMPKSSELMTGDRMAVNIPVRMPYLYAAISVKK